MRVLYSAYVLTLDGSDGRPKRVRAGETRRFGPELGARLSWYGIEGSLIADPGARVAFGAVEVSAELAVHGKELLQVEDQSFAFCCADTDSQAAANFTMFRIADPETTMPNARRWLPHVGGPLHCFAIRTTLPALEPAARARARYLLAHRLARSAFGPQMLMHLTPDVFLICHRSLDHLNVSFRALSDVNMALSVWGEPVAACVRRITESAVITTDECAAANVDHYLGQLLARENGAF